MDSQVMRQSRQEARGVYSRKQMVTGTRRQKQVTEITAKQARDRTKEKATVAHKVAENNPCKVHCTAPLLNMYLKRAIF